MCDLTIVAFKWREVTICMALEGEKYLGNVGMGESVKF